MRIRRHCLDGANQTKKRTRSALINILSSHLLSFTFNFTDKRLYWSLWSRVLGLSGGWNDTSRLHSLSEIPAVY